jgi:hypothetical protein
VGDPYHGPADLALIEQSSGAHQRGPIEKERPAAGAAGRSVGRYTSSPPSRPLGTGLKVGEVRP